MKTIFRSSIAAAMFAAVIALGAVAGFAQDPCMDADGQTALGDKFRAAYPKKDIPGRQEAIDLGKQFLEKYGSCDPAKELSDYLRTQIPAMEKRLADAKKAAALKDLENRFVGAMKSKNWDDLMASGKQLLGEDADKYRDVEIALGSVGLDETLKVPPVTKWNDDSLRFAKQAIADLEGGKTFKTYGVFVKDGANFQYKDKSDALGWLNLTIGVITSIDKKDGRSASGYLYKATMPGSTATTFPVLFRLIGNYYFDDVNKLYTEVAGLAKEIKGMEDGVKPADSPEVKQQKIDAIKAKVETYKARLGILNGTVERAMDAYSRAYTIAPADNPSYKGFRDSVYKTIGELYNIRFEKMDGIEAWVKAAPAKPLPDPSSVIVPVLDPEPVTTTTPTTTSTSTPATNPIKPPAQGTKPPTPGAKPATGGKPQSVTTSGSKASGTTATTSKPAGGTAAKKQGGN